MKRVGIVLLLLLVTLMSNPLTAYAIDTNGGSGTAQAVVSQEPSVFSVTIPTGLPVNMDANGDITVANNLSITNNSYGPVRVSAVSVDVDPAWTLVAFNYDMKSESINAKKVGFQINGNSVDTGTGLVPNVETWASIDGSSSLAVSYNANISAQPGASTALEIASITFTVGWDVEPSLYTLATDADFSGTTNGTFRYIGTADYVEIPHVIKGVPVTSYQSMFSGTDIKGVKSTNTNIISIPFMFFNVVTTDLDLSQLNTSSVTSMDGLFNGITADSIDISSFDMSNVVSLSEFLMGGIIANDVDMSGIVAPNLQYAYSMLEGAHIGGTLDISGFTAASMEDLDSMFNDSNLGALNISGFNAPSATSMAYMFNYTVIGEGLDLSGFNVPLMKNVQNAFNGTEVDFIDISSLNLNIPEQEDFEAMFRGTTATVCYVKDAATVTYMNAFGDHEKPVTLTFTTR